MLNDKSSFFAAIGSKSSMQSWEGWVWDNLCHEDFATHGNNVLDIMAEGDHDDIRISMQWHTSTKNPLGSNLTAESDCQIAR